MKLCVLLPLVFFFCTSCLTAQQLETTKRSITATPIALHELGEQMMYEKMAWVDSPEGYMLTAVVRKGEKTETVIISTHKDGTIKKSVLNIPKTQTLRIDNIIELYRNEVFLQGVIFCTKNPTKKLYNWIAVCDHSGKVLREKKMKYKKYQAAVRWTSYSIGLLHNPTKKGEFGNRPEIEVVDIEPLMVVRKVILEFEQSNVFVNTFGFSDFSSKQIIAIGMETPTLHQGDSVQYAPAVFSVFDYDGHYVRNLLHDKPTELFEVSANPIPLNYAYDGSYTYTGRISSTRSDNSSTLNDRAIVYFTTDDTKRIASLLRDSMRKSKKINCFDIFAEQAEYVVEAGSLMMDNDREYPWWNIDRIILDNNSKNINLTNEVIGYESNYFDDKVSNNEFAKDYLNEKNTDKGEVMLIKYYHSKEKKELYIYAVVMFTPKTNEGLKRLVTFKYVVEER